VLGYNNNNNKYHYATVIPILEAWARNLFKTFDRQDNVVRAAHKKLVE